MLPKRNVSIRCTNQLCKFYRNLKLDAPSLLTSFQKLGQSPHIPRSHFELCEPALQAGLLQLSVEGFDSEEDEVNTPNLFRLLSVITIPHLKAYLANQGWNADIADGRLNFTMESGQGEWQRIFVPADRAHPRFRSQLQNLMFSLAVIENREPAEVAHDISVIQIPKVVEALDLGHQLHDIASLIRGLAQECNESEQAKGKILELARFLLAYQSLSIGLTSKLADELWEVARSDKAYLPAATLRWFETNAKYSSSK